LVPLACLVSTASKETLDTLVFRVPLALLGLLDPQAEMELKVYQDYRDNKEPLEYQVYQGLKETRETWVRKGRKDTLVCLEDLEALDSKV